MDKQLLEQEAGKSWEETTKHFKEGVNPTAYILGYKTAATSSSTVKELEREVERRNEIIQKLFSEMENNKAIVGEWISVEVIPNADGWYLCFLVIKNECGTFSKEMRVLECRMAEWQITNNRNIRITHWMLLPQEPKRTVKLLQNKSKLNSK